MPIYEYHCPACDTDFELWRRYEQGHAKHCPDCGSELERLFSTFAFKFHSPGYSPETSAREEKITEEVCLSD